jgi:phage-related protein
VCLFHCGAFFVVHWEATGFTTARIYKSSIYNSFMPVFDDKQEELEHYETMMGVPRGRLAVTMDMITDAMALVGQHGVYCQSQRWPGKPVMDIQIIMNSLTGAKELIQSVMEELKAKQ